MISCLKSSESESNEESDPSRLRVMFGDAMMHKISPLSLNRLDGGGLYLKSMDPDRIIPLGNY